MRFYYMVVIIAGILLMLNMAGVTTPSGSLIKATGLVGSNGNLTYSNVKNSTVFGNFNNSKGSPKNSLAYILSGIVLLGIAASLFGRSPDIRWATGGFVLLVTGILLGDLAWLFGYVQKLGVVWITSILSLLIGAMIVGLVVTAIQFWVGND